MNIIVTGASKGIGFELVKAFSTDSANNIIAISRNQELLTKLKKECLELNNESNVFPVPFDLGSFDRIVELLTIVKEKFENLDILVNNAGYLVNKPFQELEGDDFGKLFTINVKSVFKLVQVLLPLFAKNSHIVNISSMGGFQGSAKFPGLSLYAASKGALAILSECMAEEFKDMQIKVNCLALGAVQTEMLSQAFPGYEAPVKPDEMATFIKDFALNGHKVYNGKILPVSLSTP